MTSFNYIVLKSTWGISINFTGELTTNSECSIKFSEKLNLPLDFKNILRAGIRMAQHELNPNIKLSIYIDSIDYGFADFQKEGLFYGVYKWIEKELSLDFKQINVEFNSLKNEYVFNDFEKDYLKYSN
jgi:hypothetical protein